MAPMARPSFRPFSEGTLQRQIARLADRLSLPLLALAAKLIAAKITREQLHDRRRPAT